MASSRCCLCGCIAAWPPCFLQYYKPCRFPCCSSHANVCNSGVVQSTDALRPISLTMQLPFSAGRATAVVCMAGTKSRKERTSVRHRRIRKKVRFNALLQEESAEFPELAASMLSRIHRSIMYCCLLCLQAGQFALAALLMRHIQRRLTDIFFPCSCSWMATANGPGWPSTAPTTTSTLRWGMPPTVDSAAR